MQNLINLIRILLNKILPKNRVGDKIYCFINFIIKHKGRFPSNRMLFNDYMYRLKISNELVSKLRIYVTDKENLKSHVKIRIGDKFNVPTLKVFKKFDDLLDFKIPDNCVIKPTHLSGEVIIKKNNSEVDFKKIKKWFKTNYYNRAREAQYKYLEPKIIIEPVIFNNYNISDYKFFCFKGKTRLVQIDSNRFRNRSKSFYKIDRIEENLIWTKQNFFNYQANDEKIEKPNNLDEMIRISEILGKDFEFIRVDLYTDGIEVLVGELTSICGNASLKFYPDHNSEEICSNIIFR